MRGHDYKQMKLFLIKKVSTPSNFIKLNNLGGELDLTTNYNKNEYLDSFYTKETLI